MRAQQPISARSEAARCFGGAGLGAAAATLCFGLVTWLQTPAMTGDKPYAVLGGTSGLIGLIGALVEAMGMCVLVGTPLIAAARWTGRRAGQFARPVRYGAAALFYLAVTVVLAPTGAPDLGISLWAIVAAAAAIAIADHIDHLDRRASCAS